MDPGVIPIVLRKRGKDNREEDRKNPVQVN
jgi:hypothetical protein